MQRVQKNELPANKPPGRLRRLPLLLAMLAATGAAVAQPARSSPVPTTKSGATTYRVINLAPGLLATLPT